MFNKNGEFRVELLENKELYEFRFRSLINKDESTESVERTNMQKLSPTEGDSFGFVKFGDGPELPNTNSGVKQL